MPTDKERIQAKAIEVLKKHKRGLRHSRLIEILLKDFPNKANTISTYVQLLDKDMKDQVYKPARGLFKHTDYRKEEKEKPEAEEKEEVSEDAFYEGFADYLKSELQECTISRALGGNKFKDKWGTPDVIAVLSGKERGAIVEHEDIIISAEIKSNTSTSELLTAFGQACAYKAFSHKAYCVIPKSSDPEDISRIESLCLIFGIGLILFDCKKPEEPDFEIMTRPVKTEPD